MDGKTVIEIKSITRKDVTTRAGSPATITEIVDGKTGRAGKTWDAAWSKGWSVGDTVEIVWGKQNDPYTNKAGVTQTSWMIDNPSKAAGGSRGGAPRGGLSAAVPMLVYSFQIAAFLAPVITKFKEKDITLDLIEKLALQIKAKLEKGEAAAAKTEAPKEAAAPAAVEPAPVKTPAPAPAPVAEPVEDNFVEDEDELF